MKMLYLLNNFKIFKGIGKFERDQMLAKISKNIFQNKKNLSFNAITDLQKLIDCRCL